MNLKKNKSLTLTELIVSAVLMGIVSIGAVAIDLSLRNMRQATSRNAIVAMRTSAVMADITRYASQATGHATNMGIRDMSNNHRTLCIRWEDPATQTPADYSDDKAVCYSLEDDSRNIYRCEFNPWSAWTECDTIEDPNADLVIGTTTGYNYLDPAQRPHHPEDGFKFLLPTKATPYLEVTLINRYRPEAAADPVDNPEYRMTSRIIPGAHSF